MIKNHTAKTPSQKRSIFLPTVASADQNIKPQDISSLSLSKGCWKSLSGTQEVTNKSRMRLDSQKKKITLTKSVTILNTVLCYSGKKLSAHFLCCSQGIVTLLYLPGSRFSEFESLGNLIAFWVIAAKSVFYWANSWQMQNWDQLPSNNISILGTNDPLGCSVTWAGAVVNCKQNRWAGSACSCLPSSLVEALKWRVSVFRARSEGRCRWNRPHRFNRGHIVQQCERKNYSSMLLMVGRNKRLLLQTVILWLQIKQHLFWRCREHFCLQIGILWFDTNLKVNLFNYFIISTQCLLESTNVKLIKNFL